MLFKKTKKIALAILAIIQILALNLNFVYAQPYPVYQTDLGLSNLGTDMGPILGTEMGPNLGSSMAENLATGAAETLEKRYNLDLSSMQDAGQNFNVMENKKMGPQVMLTFNPASPKPNEDVTASASPIYFNGETKNMYFTWYIKHQGCDLGITGLNDSGLSAERKKIKDKCDVDGDGDVTVNDWKVDAMRRIAGNDFNWSGAKDEERYKMTNSNKDGDWAPNMSEWEIDSYDSTDETYEDQNRGDGYRAYFGGEDQKALEKELLLPTGDAKEFVCAILTILGVNRTQSNTEDNEEDTGKADRKKLYDLLDCQNSASGPTDTVTNEDLAGYCLKTEACITAIGSTNLATLSAQETANGCRNSVDTCVDHSDPADGTVGCVQGSGNPESDCWGNAATEVNPYKEVSSLDTTCRSDSSCPTTAMLMKYYPGVYSQYSNLYSNACSSSGESDCMKTYSDAKGSLTLAAACAADSSCPSTALATLLNGSAQGQALLAATCTATASCAEKSTVATNWQTKINAFKYLVTFFTDPARIAQIKEFIEQFPDMAKDIENAINQAKDAYEQFQREFGDMDLTPSAMWDYIWDADNLGRIQETISTINNIFESITDLLYRLVQNKSHCYVHDFATGLDYEIGNRCDQSLHVFPKALGYIGDLKAGNGHFGPQEELFWHTNPEDPSTADNGNVDEANVVGLGQTSFTWTYQPGDQVGVAVEGVYFMGSKYDDASMKVMWALPRNIFDDGDCGIDKDGVIEQYIKGYKVQIPKAKFRTGDKFRGKGLNRCLESNLIDPTQGGQAEKIGLTLNYSPKNPINNSGDPSINKLKYDTLEVFSTITTANTTNKSLINYAWSASYTTDPDLNTNNWKAIPTEVMKKLTSQNAGKGLDTLKLKLNLTKDDTDGTEATFLKIFVTAKENLYGSINNEGSKSIIIPIFSASNQIVVYPVEVAPDTGIISESTAETGALPDECIYGNCTVAKNDIIGVKIDNSDGNLSNFSWTIDDIPFTPLSGCADGECSKETGTGDNKSFGLNTEKAYFPVTKEPGQQHVVVLNADGADGKKVRLTKVFTVAEPIIKLFAKDFGSNESTPSVITNPVQLGNYIQLTGEKIPDFDFSEFVTAPGTKITVTAVPNFSFSKLQKFSWEIEGLFEIEFFPGGEGQPEKISIDGVPVSTDPSGKLQFSEEKKAILEKYGIKNLEIVNTLEEKSLVFEATKQIGESYSFSTSGIYTQTKEIKIALNKNWGIPLSDFYESSVDDRISLNIDDVPMPNGSEATSLKNSKKILATIFSGFPNYFTFLFKISLTSLLLLFSAWLIITFLPQKNEI